MSQLMLEQFRDRMVTGLKKKSITTASKWAESYRIMGGSSFPGPWRFKHHPWLKAMHDSKAERNVGQKAAQMGYTEAMLNLTFYNIDVLRRDCLYVLPAKTPDASDFSASRFDPALELSDYLSRLFSDVQNIGHKRAGAVNLYIRGSKSRAGLKSIPASFLVLDEVDEMDQKNIPLAEERQSGQLNKQTWMISTPTIEGTGINKYFQDSTQEHYFFRCPCCSKFIELKWPDSIVITANEPNDPKIEDTHLICYECKGVLKHEMKYEYFQNADWVAQKHNTSVRGFYVNQLYSPTRRPAEVASLYLKSLSDEAAEQEFFNSKLGQTHAVAGARVNDEMLNKCIGSHHTHRDGYYVGNGKPITMGVDVGRVLHYEIDEWDVDKKAPYGDLNTYSRPKVIAYGKVHSFSELDRLLAQYGVHFTVIDMNPERRLAVAFTQKNYGRAKMCVYSRGISGRHTVPSKEEDQAVNVDRTSWLDMSLGRFHRGKDGILLPIDIDLEYREQIKAQTRVPLKDPDGNPMAKYLTPDKLQDHYGHARNYAEIALQFALGLGVVHDADLRM